MPCRSPEAIAQQRAKGRERYHANKEAIRERRRAVSADPDKLAARREYHRKYNVEKVKRKYRFGISQEAFAAKLIAQGGRCAICRADKPGGRGDWVLDHSHDFDKRDPAGHRGILCTRCNVMLGMALDAQATLVAGAAYLASWATGPVLDSTETNNTKETAA